MPLPTPQQGESQSEFMGRCIPEVMDEADSADQAAAICFSRWREQKRGGDDE